MTAVKRNGLVLEAVPGELRTPQICRAALKAVDSADYKILPYIPYPDICLEGLKKFGMSFVDKFEIFASIAPEVMTGELALHGVGMDASCLSLVPVELRTEAVCLRAVSGDGILLHEVPEELRTERVCEAAVSSNYLALEYVPKHLKTDRLCGMALERDPLAIRFFNPEQLTPEVCNRALARTDDLRVLRYIPFEEIHLKVLGFYCTNYDKTFDFLENMNPAPSRRGWPGKSSPWSRSCSTTFPTTPRTRRCAAGPSGTTGATCNMSPRSGKRRSCAWRPYGAVPMPSPTCPRA